MSRRLFALGVFLAVAAGCTLARGTLADGTRDASEQPMDAAVASPDVGSPAPDATRDGFASTPDAFLGDDAAAEDAAADDAAADDAATVDAAMDDAAPDLPDAFIPPLRTCDELYRDVPSYELCAESPTDCEFYVLLSGGTCAAVCTGHAASCVTSYANGAGGANCGRASGGDACDATHTDEICVCSRVP